MNNKKKIICLVLIFFSIIIAFKTIGILQEGLLSFDKESEKYGIDKCTTSCPEGYDQLPDCSCSLTPSDLIFGRGYLVGDYASLKEHYVLTQMSSILSNPHLISSLDSNIIPSVNDTYNLGSDAKRWAEIYGHEIYGVNGSFKKLGGVRYANEWADDPNAAGTFADPYVRGIQNAIESWDQNELVRNDVVGGIIFLPPGYYFEYADGKDHLIQMEGTAERPICSIIGSGMGSSIIYAPDNQDAHIIGINSSFAIGTLVRFADFQVTGNHLNQASGQGFRTFGGFNVGDIRLERLFFRKIRDTIVNIGGFTYRINDCIFGDSTTSTLALNLDSASWAMNHVYHNYIADMSAGSGVRITDDRITMQDNDIRNMGGYGIELRATTETKIHNNRISDFDSGSSGLYNGIYLRGDYGAPQNNSIHDNLITTQFTGKYGIQVGKDNTDTDVNYNNIHDNMVDDAGSGAIYVFPAVAQSNSIYNNIPPQPFGVIATPFNNTVHVIVPVGGDAAGPTVANQNYTVRLTPARIIATGGTGVNINVTVWDNADNLIKIVGNTTIDEWLEPTWKIDFGNFTVAPTVTVIFK